MSERDAGCTPAAFLAVAAGLKPPNCRIAQDQCEAVVSALTSLRQRNTKVKPPTLIILSSGGTEDRFRKEVPWRMSSILFTANAHIYHDLIKAEQFLRSQHDHWLSMVFVKPAGLSHDVARGHIISTKNHQTFLSYLDLANAMVEIADAESGTWDGKVVSVLSHGKGQFCLGVGACVD